MTTINDLIHMAAAATAPHWDGNPRPTWNAAVELPGRGTLACWLLTGRGRTTRKPRHWRETFALNGKEISKKTAAKILRDNPLQFRAQRPILGVQRKDTLNGHP
jgi:hypothetical protein